MYLSTIKKNVKEKSPIWVSCVGRRKVTHPFCLRLCNLRTSKTFQRYLEKVSPDVHKTNWQAVEMYRAFQITKPLAMQWLRQSRNHFLLSEINWFMNKTKRDLKLRFKNRNLNIYKQITLEIELKCNCVAREIKTFSAVRLEKVSTACHDNARL